MGGVWFLLASRWKGVGTGLARVLNCMCSLSFEEVLVLVVIRGPKTGSSQLHGILDRGNFSRDSPER